MQKTQKAYMKPEDFQVQVKNYLVHRQPFIVRNGIKYKEMDVSRCSTDNLHFVLVELLELPIGNVYACNCTMKE